MPEKTPKPNSSDDAGTMLLAEIPKLFRYPYWLNEPSLFKEASSGYVAQKDDHDIICKRASEAVNKRKARDAANWITVGIVLQNARCLALWRRHGFFRLSKHAYANSTIVTVVSELLKYSHELHLPQPTVEYLLTVHNLHSIGAQLLKAHQRILATLHEEKEHALKAILATTEHVFLNYRPSNFLAKSTDASFHSPEEYAEGCSYILNLYHRHFGPPRYNIGLSSDRIMTQRYVSLLIDSAHIRAFGQWEILADVLDYTVRYDVTEKQYYLEAPAEDLEKALRYGFIATALQKEIVHTSKELVDLFSLASLTDKYSEKCGDLFVKRIKHPVERLVFSVPMDFLQKLLSEDRLFREEYATFLHASTDLLVDIDELRTLEVCDGLTIWDLTKIQRILVLISRFASTHLQRLFESQPRVAWQSLVPSFAREEMRQLLANAIGSEKAALAMDLLIWKPSDTRAIDIQYQPFIEFGNAVCIPSNVMAKSDIIRNTLHIMNKRPSDPGDLALIEKVLASSFDQIGVNSKRNVRYEFKGCHGEIDLLAHWDGYLFVFECKKPLLPCSIYELRTSVDHIRKGADQLSKVRELFQDAAFRTSLGVRCGVRLAENTKLVTCIAVSNRMLCGYEVLGHPIGSVFEIRNYLLEGKILVNDQEIKLWKNEKPSGDELKEVIQDRLITQRFFDSMEQYYLRYCIGDCVVNQSIFHLNVEQLCRAWGVELPNSEAESEVS